MSSVASGLRSLAGVLAKDWLRYRRSLSAPGRDYLGLCNRDERLEPAPQGEGYRCLWQWTSTLHAPTVLPGLGLRLMRRALADHPVGRAEAPASTGWSAEVSFVIGHRGASRTPLLLATLESIAAQRGAHVECIVVNQDADDALARELPGWVRYVHTPPPAKDMAYARSWAFNVGARHASAPLIVLHDNDLLVPQDYAACLLRHAREGSEVINLKRFLFYVDERHTRAYLDRHAPLTAAPPEAIVQNTEGGGSIAITREAFQRIGGMDESFIGWGGEDNEFWERAQTLRVWPYGYLPLVHLWHASQPGKETRDNPTLDLYRRLSAVPAAERIERLKERESGLASGPVAASVDRG